MFGTARATRPSPRAVCAESLLHVYHVINLSGSRRRVASNQELGEYAQVVCSWHAFWIFSGDNVECRAEWLECIVPFRHSTPRRVFLHTRYLMSALRHCINL